MNSNPMKPWVPYLCLAVALAYAAYKALAVRQLWFHGLENWIVLFRPFPDWGTGSEQYGSLLPSKWIGTRTMMYILALYSVTVIALFFRQFRLAAFFVLEGALIELLDIAWLARGLGIGWAPPGAAPAIFKGALWAALLMGAGWLLFRSEAASRSPAPRPASESVLLPQPWSNLLLYFFYLMAVSFALMKWVFAYWWDFDGADFWSAAFRPFPDWGSGADLFGALLPAKWIGTRNFAYGLIILFAVWYSWRRGRHLLLAVLMLQGALIEFFDGFWLANGKYNLGWQGPDTDFYMNGGFLWTPDLILCGLYFLRRSVSASGQPGERQSSTGDAATA